MSCRTKHREAGVPDMDLESEHLPCDWFAQLGFFRVLEIIGPSEPAEDWSKEGGTDADHEAYLAARRDEHQRVAEWLRCAKVRTIQYHNGMWFGDLQIAWPDRVPALKVWAGQQTLAKLAKQRQKALPKKVSDVLAAEASISGSSGLDKSTATTSLEDGFSVHVQGMQRITRVGMELLAMIGAECIPLTVYPDGRIGYTANDSRWAFCVEARGDYYGRWSEARLVI